MNKMIKNTCILTAITLIAGCLLGLVYEVTKAPIARAKEADKQAAYQKVLPDAESFENYADFDGQQATSLVQDAGYAADITEAAQALDANGNVMGYVISVTSHEAYAGDLSLSVGILNDGTVKGVEMLSIGETAGLGMKADESEFKDQLKDKNVEKFTYTKNGEKGDDKIDAISGATITTNAVTNAVDSALVYFQNTFAQQNGAGGVSYE